MQRVSAATISLAEYDEIIDARSPAEYRDDHIPGAINLPVLSDEERARVGTIYKQESVFEARKIGAALVSENIAGHLRQHLSEKPGGYKPLIYCWRGGQRSRSMALVMEQVGWPVHLLEGGYKAFRHRVLEELQTLPEEYEYRVLAGLTGTGKTEILRELDRRGEQVLDLEELANHQGSLLGAPEGGQGVSQKRFESKLWHALKTMSPQRGVWVEAESAKIGAVFCPKALLRKLRTSMRIEVVVPMEDRVAYLNQGYKHWQDKPELLLQRLDWLKKRHGSAELELWAELVAANKWDEFVRRLLEVHYDPSYRGAHDHASGEREEIVGRDLLGNGCAQMADVLLSKYPS